MKEETPTQSNTGHTGYRIRVADKIFSTSSLRQNNTEQYRTYRKKNQSSRVEHLSSPYRLFAHDSNQPQEKAGWQPEPDAMCLMEPGTSLCLVLVLQSAVCSLQGRAAVWVAVVWSDATGGTAALLQHHCRAQMLWAIGKFCREAEIETAASGRGSVSPGDCSWWLYLSYYIKLLEIVRKDGQWIY